MSGRHHSSAPGRPRSVLWLIVLVVLLAVSGTVAVVVYRSGSSTNAAREPSTRPSTASRSCTTGVSLSVAADPSIAAVVTQVAATWTASKPVIDGACPTVTVRSQASAAASATYAGTNIALPDIWIPDSTLWVDRLRAATAGIDTAANSIWLSPAIATSPLVLATTPGSAASVRSDVAGGWRSVLAGAIPVATDDPANNTDGLLAVLTATSVLNNGAAAPSRSFVNSLVALAHASVPSAAAGLQAIERAPGDAKPVVASEQQVRQAAVAPSDGSPAKVAAVYPPGPSMGFDWPVAQFTPPGGDPARRDAAVAFVAQLNAADAQRQLRAIGLRDVSGTPLAGTPAARQLPVPGAATVSDALRAWTAAKRTNRTLVVIDLSGSMAETIGGGQTKIAFAAAAAQAVTDFLPDSSALGLWGFSVDRTPSADWRQLVSLGPLGAKVGTTTRRAALNAIAKKLPTMTNGATGLYSTALAAYQAVRSGYDPASINSVVLLTDGANTDTRGADLAALLSTLRSERDAARPLPLNTIAVGADADVSTLRQLAAATGGTEYTAAKPSDIRDVFLDAVIRAA